MLSTTQNSAGDAAYRARLQTRGSVPAFRALSAVGTGEKGIKASSRSGEKKQEWNH